MQKTLHGLSWRPHKHVRALAPQVRPRRTIGWSPCSALSSAQRSFASSFFFYRPTGRPRRTSLPLECNRNKKTRTYSVFAARPSIRASRPKSDSRRQLKWQPLVTHTAAGDACTGRLDVLIALGDQERGADIVGRREVYVLVVWSMRKCTKIYTGRPPGRRGILGAGLRGGGSG